MSLRDLPEWGTAWDGAPRLDTFFQDYFKTPGEAGRARRFFGALAVSVMAPGRSQSDVPVLVGAAADVAEATTLLDTLSHRRRHSEGSPSSIAFVDGYAREGERELLCRGERRFARSGVFAVVRAPSVAAAKVSPHHQALYIWVGKLGGDSTRRRLAENRSQLLAEARVRIEGPATLGEYLLHLQWDGTSRLQSWLTTYGGAQDSPQTRWLGMLWPLLQVRAAIEGGPVEAPMFGLYGTQAIGKSRLVSTFMQPLFEWDATSIEVEGTSTDYEAFARRMKLLAVRGWVPVATHGSASTKPQAGVRWVRIRTAPDIDGLTHIREQLWAEAVSIWRQGDPLQIAGAAASGWQLVDPVESQSATQASDSVLHDCPELCKALARPDVQKLLARPGVDGEFADMLVAVAENDAGARVEGLGDIARAATDVRRAMGVISTTADRIEAEQPERAAELAELRKLIGAVLQHMEDYCDA